MLVVVSNPEEKIFQRTLERWSGTQRFEFSRKTIPRLWSSDRKRPLIKLEVSSRHGKNALRGVASRSADRDETLSTAAIAGC